MSLYNSAIQVIKEDMKSNNEAVKLKAAFWLIEKITSQNIGETNPREIIKKQCTYSDCLIDLYGLDEVKYKQMCRENNTTS